MSGGEDLAVICCMFLLTDWVSFKWRFRQPCHINQPWAVSAESQLGTTVEFSSQTPGGAAVCTGRETTSTAEKATRFLHCSYVQYRWCCGTANVLYWFLQLFICCIFLNF